MKKIIVSLLCILLVASVTACMDNAGVNDLETAQVEEAKVEESSSESIKWKEFIADYNEWVDKYIALAKKFKESPTDFTILSDYTSMAKEISEWSTRSQEIQEEMTNASPKEIAEYSAELLKITKKLAEVAY